jgi:hypothetical protein
MVQADLATRDPALLGERNEETDEVALLTLSPEAMQDLETLRQHPVPEWQPPQPTVMPTPVPDDGYEPAYYD